MKSVDRNRNEKNIRVSNHWRELFERAIYGSFTFIGELRNVFPLGLLWAQWIFFNQQIGPHIAHLFGALHAKGLTVNVVHLVVVALYSCFLYMFGSRCQCSVKVHQLKGGLYWNRSNTKISKTNLQPGSSNRWKSRVCFWFAKNATELIRIIIFLRIQASTTLNRS